MEWWAQLQESTDVCICLKSRAEELSLPLRCLVLTIQFSTCWSRNLCFERLELSEVAEYWRPGFPKGTSCDVSDLSSSALSR